jgi:hypothetical protein
VELSISSVEAQMEKYHQLLRKHCATEVSILNYMLAYINASDYIWAEVFGNKPEDLPEGSMVKEKARLWHKIAQLHLRDVEDLEHNVAALQNALPTIPTAAMGGSLSWLPTGLWQTPLTLTRWTPLPTPRTIFSPSRRAASPTATSRCPNEMSTTFLSPKSPRSPPLLLPPLATRCPG